MGKSKWDSQDEERSASHRKTVADEALDAFPLGQAGGAGGSRERAAWILLACYSDEASTVELACRGALSKGAGLLDLAHRAMECDSAPALGWCVDESERLGGSGPFIEKPDKRWPDGPRLDLASHAIDAGAGSCVGMLERRFGPLTCPIEFEPRREDALVSAARSLSLAPVESILAVRGTGPTQAQEAMDALASRLGSLRVRFKECVGIARALATRGARLGGVSKPGASEPPGHAHAIVGMLMGDEDAKTRAARDYEANRALDALWRMARENAGWTGWTAAGKAELGLHVLGQLAVEKRMVEAVFADDPGLLSDPRSAEALARGACLRSAARSSDMVGRMEQARELGCVPPRPEALARIMSEAMPLKPGDISAICGSHWERLFEAFAKDCPPDLAAIAMEAARLHALCADKGRPKSDAAWAPWEEASLAMEAWSEKTKPSSSRPRI